MIRRILTHSGPAHCDEFLAVSLLLLKHPQAVVERVPELSADEVDEDTVVVDVGRRYDGVRFFDHHQDIDIPSSFFLVLRDVYGISLEDLPSDFVYVDVADRMGHRHAAATVGQARRSLAEKALLKVFMSHTTIKPQDPLHEVMKAIGKNLLAILDEYQQAKKTRFIETPLGFIAVTETPLSIALIEDAHPDKSIIGVIMPSRDGGTLLAKVSDNPFFNPAATSYPKKFVHATKFAAVVDLPINHVDPLRIAIECVSS